MAELKPVEKLAIAQACYKTIAGIVSTKDPDSLRGMCDQDAIANYLSTGAKSYDVRLMGEKVGTYSVRVNKPKRVEKLRVTDMDAYVAWCVENACMTTDDQQAERRFQETGELPDGCELEVTETSETVAGATLKVDEGKVADALGDALPAVAAHALFGWELPELPAGASVVDENGEVL